MKRKSILCVVWMFVLMLSWGAVCLAQEGEDTAEFTVNTVPDESVEGVVGVCLKRLSEEFIAGLQDAIQAQAELYPNVEFRIVDAENDSAKQITQFESFLEQKVDCIILNPTDAEMLTETVRKGIESGTPVITLSSDCTEDVGQTWIGTANENGGDMQARFTFEKLEGKGNIAILRGPLGEFAEIGRYAGYEMAMQDYPDIRVVFDQTANWSREEAMTTMENWLQTGEQIDAVLCQNDEMALGAYQAIEAEGKAGEIIISGIDAIMGALESVRDGKLNATLFQDGNGQGKGAVDMAVKVMKGEPIMRTDIPFELVTQDNVDEYFEKVG